MNHQLADFFFSDLTNRDSGCGYSAASSDVSSLGGHPITSLMDEIRNFRKTNLNSVAPKVSKLKIRSSLYHLEGKFPQMFFFMFLSL